MAKNLVLDISREWWLNEIDGAPSIIDNMSERELDEALALFHISVDPAIASARHLFESVRSDLLDEQPSNGSADSFSDPSRIKDEYLVSQALENIDETEIECLSEFELDKVLEDLKIDVMPTAHLASVLTCVSSTTPKNLVVQARHIERSLLLDSVLANLVPTVGPLLGTSSFLPLRAFSRDNPKGFAQLCIADWAPADIHMKVLSCLGPNHSLSRLYAPFVVSICGGIGKSSPIVFWTQHFVPVESTADNGSTANPGELPVSVRTIGWQHRASHFGWVTFGAGSLQANFGGETESRPSLILNIFGMEFEKLKNMKSTYPLDQIALRISNSLLEPAFPIFSLEGNVGIMPCSHEHHEDERHLMAISFLENDGCNIGTMVRCYTLKLNTHFLSGCDRTVFAGTSSELAGGLVAFNATSGNGRICRFFTEKTSYSADCYYRETCEKSDIFVVYDSRCLESLLVSDGPSHTNSAEEVVLTAVCPLSEVKGFSATRSEYAMTSESNYSAYDTCDGVGQMRLAIENSAATVAPHARTLRRSR